MSLSLTGKSENETTTKSYNQRRKWGGMPIKSENLDCTKYLFPDVIAKCKLVCPFLNRKICKCNHNKNCKQKRKEIQSKSENLIFRKSLFPDAIAR
jgi:hypothetical protein